MSYTIRPAALQQDASPSGAFDHLAPVVDLLHRSQALPKYQQPTGARRWHMKLGTQLVAAAGRTWAGLRSFLTLVGGAAVLGAFALPLAPDDWMKRLGAESLWDSPT